MTACHPPAEEGFALLDALVALAIFGVIFGMFIEVVQTTAMARRHAADSRRAVLVAQSRLAQALESDEPEPTGRDGALRWQAEVARYPGRANGHGLEQLTVTVADAASGRRLATLKTLRLVR